MKTTKAVLIIGGSGFLGNLLALKLREKYKVFATYYHNRVSISGVTTLPFSIENKNWVKRVIYTTRPDVVVYLAGKNSVEWADKQLHRAEMVHAGGPAAITANYDVVQPRLIFVSNSYVFDGTKGNYHENDTVLPGNILGKMKLSGENIIKSKCLNYVILRSSPVFGRSNGLNPSFIDRLRMSLVRKQRIEVPQGEYHSFAPADGLCDLIGKLIESGVRNRALHYGGLTKTTKYEFARSFAARFGYDPSLITPKATYKNKDGTTDVPLLDFSLNSTQSAETLKIKPFLLEEGFDLIEKQLIPSF